MPSVYVEVEMDEFTDREILDEVKARKLHIPCSPGEGDDERRENLIERAFLAAKALPDCPRELSDMFWLVHGRARNRCQRPEVRCRQERDRPRLLRGGDHRRR